MNLYLRMYNNIFHSIIDIHWGSLNFSFVPGPQNLWTGPGSGETADYSQLRVFGCTAYAHVDNGKLEPRDVKCLFLGYGSGVKRYKLWNPETKKDFLQPECCL